MTDMSDSFDLRERGPGAALAAARTAQNLSVADVARQLKLSVSQVQALEAGEFKRLPGPVFVRGFVRNYARLLKMDPDRVVGMLEDGGGEPAPQRMPTARGVPFPTRAPRRWTRLAALAVLAVVLLAVYEFYWRDGGMWSTAQQEPPAPVATRLEPPAPAPVQAPATPQREIPAGEPDKAVASPVTPPAAGTEVATVQSPAPVEPRAEPSAATPPSEGELRLRFNRDSWVEVRDGSGQVIFTRLNPGGTTQRISGKPPFALVIGNAKGVELFYNDRTIDLSPHTVRDGVARLKLE